jgi:hypothetical protein
MATIPLVGTFLLLMVALASFWRSAPTTPREIIIRVFAVVYGVVLLAFFGAGHSLSMAPASIAIYSALIIIMMRKGGGCCRRRVP